jgi:putative ABC transport system substrate-binding protein
MSAGRHQRLAAIHVADAPGSSRLVEADAPKREPVDRRRFLAETALGGLALAALPLAAPAQKPAALPRLGLLTPGQGSSAVEAAFVQGLRDAGYVDGRTIHIERRSADGDFGKLPALAAELVNARPAAIATIVTQASIAAKEATTAIPIVIVAVSDPVAAGLVGNLAHPGGNVTGTAAQLHAAVGKQIELMRQILPRVARIAVLWNPANAVFQQQSLGTALIAASQLRVVAQPVGLRNRDEIELAVSALAGERPDAMLVLQDPLLIANRARIVELALASRIPAFSGTRILTEAGALASYGPDLALIARRAGSYVRKILNGAQPGELAVELPTKLELVVNAKTADALGVALPNPVLARADEVIR